MNMRRCGDCEFYVVRPKFNGAMILEIGMCHRFSPIENNGNISPEHWCGEFRRSMESLETFELKKAPRHQHKAGQHDPQSQESGEKS
jgi:hypothetical protein